MKKILYLCFALTLTISVNHAKADLIVGPDIIAAPASVIDDAPGAENTHQQAFTESTSVVLPSAIAVDGGTIPAGTVVDSHMIFLNTRGFARVRDIATWVFDGPVIGVMSDSNGNLEDASTGVLGSPTTQYPAGPFGARGLEGNDAYNVSGNSIRVNMIVTEPGDWIRVVTLSHLDGTIMIQPSDDPNSINLKRKGVLPVGLISTDELNALDVDLDSLQFGDPVLAGTVAPIRTNVEDIDGDGVDDVILHFDIPEIVAAGALDGDSVVAALTGVTTAGNPFSAFDSVRVVPPKK